MSLVNICPDISDNWKGGVCDVARVLGLSENTIRLATFKDIRDGGLRFGVGKNGRKKFSGKEVKRFWREH